MNITTTSPNAGAGQNSATPELITYTAPSSWASYFINGDDSGLEEDEKRAADDFLAWAVLGAPVSCEDAGFIRRPDSFAVYPYAADCQTYTFLPRVAKPAPAIPARRIYVRHQGSTIAYDWPEGSLVVWEGERMALSRPGHAGVTLRGSAILSLEA